MSKKLMTISAWYLHRLRAMTLREIFHRINEAWHKFHGQYYTSGWSKEQATSICALQIIAHKFDPVLISDSMKKTLASEADKIRHAQFHLLGCQWNPPTSWPPEREFWHQGPNEQSLPSAAERYCFKSLSLSSATGRDLKRIWEINRLQFLVPLATHAKITGNDKDKDLVFSLIFNWMDSNIPFNGLMFSAGIETALRVISVAFAISILGIEHLEKSEHDKLVSFFNVHSKWILRFPSLYSSENNHRIAEISGLIVSSLLLRDTQSNIEHYLHLLFECLDKQIHDDGIGAEQALTYTAFSIELSLIAFFCARISPDDVPAALIEKLRKWADSTLWMMDDAGLVPEIGDNDGGRGLMLSQDQEPHYVASVLAALAAWLQDSQSGPPTHDQHLRDLLFNSAAGPSITKTGIKTWPIGGYTVIRGHDDAYTMIFDHGPVGHFSIAAHGHADTLAIWLTIAQTPVFIDAGTSTYLTHDPLRNALRVTSAHNTLTLNGQSSSIPSGAFNWSHKARGSLFSTNAQPKKIGAQHDGYLSRFGAIHKREIELVASNIITISDWLEGTNTPHFVDISYLLGSGCKIQEIGKRQWGIVINERIIATITTNGPLEIYPTVNKSKNSRSCTTQYGHLHEASDILLSGSMPIGIKQFTTIEIME